MGLVIPQKTYPHRRNAYSLSCLQQSRSQWSGVWDEIVFPATANLNFWSRATFGTYHFWEKCTDPDRKWHANPICLWFFSYLGWFSWKPLFGINTHTFIFQVGHPTMRLRTTALEIQRKRGYTVNDPSPSILNAPPELVPAPFSLDLPDYKITDHESRFQTEDNTVIYWHCYLKRECGWQMAVPWGWVTITQGQR